MTLSSFRSGLLPNERLLVYPPGQSLGADLDSWRMILPHPYGACVAGGVCGGLVLAPAVQERPDGRATPR